MDKNYFQDKYLVNSARLRDWDYSWAGCYFFTVCAKDHKNYFGEVRQGIMGLNRMGCTVWQEWYKTAEIRENVRLDEFIVMPNHVHGIIEILYSCRDEAAPRLYAGRFPQMSKISPQSGSLPAIIGSIKSIAAKKIHNSGYYQFSWQPRFYDHLIRIDAESLEKIRYYIRRNPLLWDKDKINSVNFK